MTKKNNYKNIMTNTKFLPSIIPPIFTGFFLLGCNNNQASNSQAVNIQQELADIQEITINNGAEPESLDPHKISGIPEISILSQMFVGLVTTDQQGKITAGMATEWSSTDNKRWLFKLRDAKWSNGDDVSAHDFVYSMQRLVDPKTASPYASYLANLKVVNAKEIIHGHAKPETLAVKAIDNKTLEINLLESVPYFVNALAHTAVQPVNKKTVETHGNKWTSPNNFVSNGAYTLQEWKVNEHIIIKRNPNYYDNHHTTINKATFLSITNNVTDVARYKTGEIDITNDSLPPAQFQSLKKELGDQLKIQPCLCTYYYELNHTKPPFNDVRVRKALSLALERDIMTDKILNQGQKPAYQYTPEAIIGMKNFRPIWADWDKSKRITEAKKLLHEAGYNQNNPLKFELLYNTSEQHKTLALAAASFWKNNLEFVEVTLNNQEWKSYLETRRQQKYQMARSSWCADYNEPSTFLNTLLSTSSNNHSRYNNPEFDAIIHKTLVADIDPKERAELYYQAEALLDKDSTNIFVYQYVSPRLVKPYVQGFDEANPIGQYYVKDLKILKH